MLNEVISNDGDNTNNLNINNDANVTLFQKISDGMGEIINEKLKDFTSNDDFNTFTNKTEGILENHTTMIKETEEKLFNSIKEIEKNTLHLDNTICNNIINSFKEILNVKK